MLKKIEAVINHLFENEHAAVTQVAPISLRTRIAIRNTLREVGYQAPGSPRPQQLLYPELNRYGQRIWRAA